MVLNISINETFHRRNKYFTVASVFRGSFRGIFLNGTISSSFSVLLPLEVICFCMKKRDDK